jgi:ribosomal-protein-alanine N-acetyltransferase
MTLADLDAVLAIAAACPEAPRWQPTAYAPYVAPPNPPLLRTAFVAVPPTEILGFAAATLLLAGVEKEALQNLCELDSMAVHPSARRQGIGAALLRAVLDWAARNGAHRLSLEVRASNAAAIAFYRQLGLRRQGLRPGYYSDPPDDALLLAMPVTPVSDTPPFSTANVVEGGPPRC